MTGAFFSPNNKIAFSEKLFHGRLAVHKADVFQEMKLQPKPFMEKESRLTGQLTVGAPWLPQLCGVMLRGRDTAYRTSRLDKNKLRCNLSFGKPKS